MYGRSAVLARGDYGRAARMRGDPGFFSFIGKAVGTVAKAAGGLVGGPIGSVLKGAGNILAPSKVNQASAIQSAAAPRPPTGTSLIGMQVGGPRGLTVGVQKTQTTAYTGSASVTPTSDGCPKGYHLNKTGYYTASGYIPPHSKCVRNRRMNVVNPKALRKSIRRGKGSIKILRKTAGAMGYSVVAKRAPKMRKR